MLMIAFREVLYYLFRLSTFSISNSLSITLRPLAISFSLLLRPKHLMNAHRFYFAVAGGNLALFSIERFALSRVSLSLSEYR